MKAQSNSNENGSPQRSHAMDERIGSLFQPDTLLGEDYAANFRRKIPLEPERILLLAILEDGERCYHENVLISGGMRLLLFYDVKECLFSAARSWFYSF